MTNTAVDQQHAPWPSPRSSGSRASPPSAEFFEAVCAGYGVPLAGVAPHDPAIVAADRLGTRVRWPTGAVRDAIDGIIDFMQSPEARRSAPEAERERIENRLAELSS